MAPPSIIEEVFDPPVEVFSDDDVRDASSNADPSVPVPDEFSKSDDVSVNSILRYCGQFI